MEDIGKMIFSVGIFLALIGGGLFLFGKLPGVGRLPGDLIFQRDNFTLIFPFATSILISVLLTLAINLFIRITDK